MVKLLKRAIAAAFIIYFIILLRITVFRTGFDFGNIFTNGQFEPVPFIGLAELIAEGKIRNFIYLFAGNIIWFMPFGFFLVCFKQRLSMTVLYGFLLSLAIELCQYIFGVGVTETEDVILNTLGSFLGALAGRGIILKYKLF